MKKVSIHAVQRLFWILVAVIACSFTKEALSDGNYRDALERGFNAGT